MVSKFRKFIDKNGLFKDDEKILLACSGGVDSMVLADLLLINENKFGIAHINHQTRGQESDDDQSFVEQYCKENTIQCHLISAPIEDHAKALKQNFHQFARNFRYRFLHDIKERFKYDCIATAHHSSDGLETFIFNLTRGTGLDGLTGIPIKNKYVVRPLMFAHKTEIENYATKFAIEYRTDSSNDNFKYKRNYIRHEIIPQINKLTDQSIENSKATILRLRNTKSLLQELILANNFTSEKDGEIHIEKSKIDTYEEKDTLLFYLLKKYEFNFQQCQQINKSTNNIGSTFYTAQYKLLIDREYLILKEITSDTFNDISIDSPGVFKIDSNLTFSIDKASKIIINNDKNIEFIDADKLQFPLTIRKWRAGDKFKPLGMDGKQKKVQDYLTDSKLNRFEKKGQLVLVSSNEIVWIIGQRLSENVKCDESTSNYFRIELYK